MDQNDQQYEGISMQKISTRGELLWGEKGRVVIEFQNDNQYRNPQVRDAGDGTIAVFYQMMEGADSYSNPVGSFFILFVTRIQIKIFFFFHITENIIIIQFISICLYISKLVSSLSITSNRKEDFTLIYIFIFFYFFFDCFSFIRINFGCE